MADQSNPAVIVGGDPELMRKAGISVANTAVFPCQRCGRDVALHESSQRMALGDPTSVVQVVPGGDGIHFKNEGEVMTGGGPVLCMWCAFAGHPDLIAALEKAMSAG